MGQQHDAPGGPAPALVRPAEPPLDLPLEVDDLEALPTLDRTGSDTVVEDAGGQQPAV